MRTRNRVHEVSFVRHKPNRKNSNPAQQPTITSLIKDDFCLINALFISIFRFTLLVPSSEACLLSLMRMRRSYRKGALTGGAAGTVSAGVMWCSEGVQCGD